MRKFLAILVFLGAGLAEAQTYPAKPIRFIVSFPPGGSTDVVARAISPRMSERLGQPIVVENRAGAGGMLGVEVAAKSPPDGHTIALAAAGALSSNVSLYPRMPYDVEKDLAPISTLAMIPFILVAHPSKPSSLKALIESARAKPGALSWGYGGSGTTMHLAGELFIMMAKIRMQGVPYKGSGPVGLDVLGGQVPIGVVDVPSGLAHIKAGKLQALAVTSKQRMSVLPEVPTFEEAGLPGYEAVGWIGVVAPAGTPPDVISKLNSEIRGALSVPEIRERVITAGAEPLTSSPQEFAAFIRTETKKWAEVIKVAKIKLE
jgi:tripartite-type tricarboxylate transporter receptor subunit TctC